MQNRCQKSKKKKKKTELSGVALCSAETEGLPADFQLRRALKPLLEHKIVQEKNISNPYLFRGAPICSFGWKSHTRFVEISRESQSGGHKVGGVEVHLTP